MPEMTLLAVRHDAIGYGRLGLYLDEALRKLGVDIYDDIAAPVEEQNHLSVQVDGQRHKKTNVAAWVSTPGHAQGWWTGQHAAIFTMWESQRLPEAYREHLHNFDTVIVPSQQNVDLFSEHHPNVRLALLGVDPARWHYTPRVGPSRYFNFLIGGSGARKGTDLAVKAFRLAFPKGEPLAGGPLPRLVMKNPKGEDFYGTGIEMVSGRISSEEEVGLYEDAHCYLQPSRGEGFGLQPLQAMAQGIPTILTDAHGHESFAHLGWGLSAKPSTAAYFIYGDAGDWWEPNLDELVEHMRAIYLNYDVALVQGEIAAAEVARAFTWERCAEQFIDAFDGALDVPYGGSGEWFTPEFKRYLTILNRDWTADMAGGRYHYEKGVAYYEPSDVKRILFDGGLLDPKCLEHGQVGADSGLLDSGLTEKQIASIGGYSAKHSFCPECGQQMNTVDTKADLIFRHGEEARARMEAFGLTPMQIAEVMGA